MRYKIFVSAHQKELADERFAVKELINSNASLRDYFDVFLFEDLPAKGQSAEDVYLSHVKDSNIYIGIIGNKYGYIGEDGLSATEREFKHYTNANPKGHALFFVKGINETYKDRDSETGRFLQTIKDNYVYKRFQQVSDLKTDLLNSLISILDEQGLLNKLPFDMSPCQKAAYSDIDEKKVIDYLQHRAVELNVNIPGQSAQDILIKTLEGHHKTRNKVICEIFHQTLDMEKFGTGITKMRNFSKEHGLQLPQIYEEGDSLVVKFTGPGDKLLDLVPSIPEERQTDLRTIGLNDRQIKTLELMFNNNESFTIKKYINYFSITDKTAREDLRQLTKKNFIEKIGSTKGAYYRVKQ
ncbi:DUF4062 domain-containing protein [Candidatus Margulisiibacteriota bacterium]